MTLHPDEVDRIRKKQGNSYNLLIGSFCRGLGDKEVHRGYDIESVFKENLKKELIKKLDKIIK